MGDISDVLFERIFLTGILTAAGKDAWKLVRNSPTQTELQAQLVEATQQRRLRSSESTATLVPTMARRPHTAGGRLDLRLANGSMSTLVERGPDSAPLT